MSKVNNTLKNTFTYNKKHSHTKKTVSPTKSTHKTYSHRNYSIFSNKEGKKENSTLK